MKDAVIEQLVPGQVYHMFYFDNGIIGGRKDRHVVVFTSVVDEHGTKVLYAMTLTEFKRYRAQAALDGVGIVMDEQYPGSKEYSECGISAVGTMGSYKKGRFTRYFVNLSDRGNDVRLDMNKIVIEKQARDRADQLLFQIAHALRIDQVCTDTKPIIYCYHSSSVSGNMLRYKVYSSYDRAKTLCVWDTQTPRNNFDLLASGPMPRKDIPDPSIVNDIRKPGIIKRLSDWVTSWYALESA